MEKEAEISCLEKKMGKTLLKKKKRTEIDIWNEKFENDFVLLETLITELNELSSTTKALYYENLDKKLNNPLLQAKTYWSILKKCKNTAKKFL